MSDSWTKIFIRLWTAVIETIDKHVDEEVRKELYLDLIETIDEYDEKVYNELMGLSIAFDEALIEVHPDIFTEFIENIEE